MPKLPRRAVLLLLPMGVARVLRGQEQIFVCPMDPDVRSNQPGICDRCGMKLVSGIPEGAEYSMDLRLSPPAPKPMQPASLIFEVRDPWKDRQVTHFQVVHEKLFSMFVISQDL